MFEWVVEEVKAVVKYEESDGHDLDHDDLLDTFEEHCSRHLLNLLSKEKAMGLLESEMDKKVRFKKRLNDLQRNSYKIPSGERCISLLIRPS